MGREIDLVPSHVQHANNILHHQSVLLEALLPRWNDYIRRHRPIPRPSSAPLPAFVKQQASYVSVPYLKNVKNPALFVNVCQGVKVPESLRTRNSSLPIRTQHRKRHEFFIYYKLLTCPHTLSPSTTNVPRGQRHSTKALSSCEHSCWPRLISRRIINKCCAVALLTTYSNL